MERALSKSKNGIYGYCEDTGEPIDLKRFMAQPATYVTGLVGPQEARGLTDIPAGDLTLEHGRLTAGSRARSVMPRAWTMGV